MTYEAQSNWLSAAINSGEEIDTEQLLPLVYDELRKMARAKLARDRCESLSATGLVHETYMKLIDNTKPNWDSKGHFFAAAANSMRRILIDHARKRSSLKRGGNRIRIDLNVEHLSTGDADEYDRNMLKLDAALDHFEEEHPLEAELVKLRFFAGLPMVEAARIVGVPIRTAQRKWAYAKARIFQLMEDEAG